jgi:large repetitive protein
LNGNEGEDFISGGSEADEIAGGTGTDRIQGDEERDFIELGLGGDVVSGGADDDRIEDSRGNEDSSDNMIFGDDGNDFIRAGFFGGDIIFGGRGNDQIRGQENAYMALGEGGDDRLFGAEAADSLLEVQELTKLELQ